MDQILQKIYEIGIIPVIAIDNADKAVPLARALVKGGLPAAEVTFRTAAGEEAIRRIAAEVPEVLVGAGTVLSVEQCDRALAAGAKFIVSPGYNEELVAHCLAKDVPVLPGCVNASDMTRAVNAGLEYVKFFPAEQSGGISGIKALAPVFPKLKFMPTGGVNTKNVIDYLNYDRIYACGGTWMVKKDLIEGEKWDEITAICQDAVKTMLGLQLAHVGVNCADTQTRPLAGRQDPVRSLFGLEYKPGNSSDFAGSMPWSATRPPAVAPTATSPSPPTTWTGPCTTWASRASSLTRPAARPTPRAAPRPSTSRTRWAASPSTW